MGMEIWKPRSEILIFDVKSRSETPMRNEVPERNPRHENINSHDRCTHVDENESFTLYTIKQYSLWRLHVSTLCSGR